MSQRTREIGVRMALGAAPGDAQWMVLSHGLRITGLRIAGGLLPSVAFAGAGAVWLIVARLATWYPTRRATRVHPLSVLKCE